MTPEQLKASIFQCALQGKLVEQRIEEGNAELLYQSLLTAKENLVKNKAILKKADTVPFYGEEYPFDIPETWKWVQLSEVSIIQEGAGIRKFQYRDSGTQILCVTNILDGYIDLGKKKLYIDTDEYKEKYIHLTLNKGDIVTSCSGGSWGKISFFNEDGILMLNTSTLRMRFFDDLADNEYLYYVCQSALFKNQLEQQLSGMQPNFGYAHYSRICFPLPPLKEQKRIVSKIEEILPYVDRYAEAYEKLEQFNAKFPEDMKKSILQYAIQGKLVEQRAEEGTAEELYRQIQEEKQKLIKEGKIKKEKPLAEITKDEIPFDIPETWKWVRWGELSFSIQYGYNAPAKDNGRIKMVRISDIQDGKVFWETVPFCDIAEEEITTYLLVADDILFARTGGTVGKSYIVKETPENAIYAGYLIRTRYSKKLCPDYLYYFMQTQLYWSQLRNGTIATAQPNCNGQTLSKMIIPLPPLEEQHRIVAKIEELLPYCDKLANKE